MGVALIVLLDLIGRRRARLWTMQPDAEFGDDPESLTVLNLGQVEPRAVIGTSVSAFRRTPSLVRRSG